ncbi:MAG TPA: site-specific integrase, partial [Ktedonobacteraceae bacterium]
MVVVADQTLQWLDHYRQVARPIEAIRLNHGIFFCEHGGKDQGHPLSLETLQYFFESMSKSEDQGGTGIHITPHMLRHTWATMAQNDRLPIHVIQQQLGHAHVSTTELYSHVAPEERRQTLQEWRESHPELYGRITL